MVTTPYLVVDCGLVRVGGIGGVAVRRLFGSHRRNLSLRRAPRLLQLLVVLFRRPRRRRGIRGRWLLHLEEDINLMTRILST